MLIPQVVAENSTGNELHKSKKLLGNFQYKKSTDH